MNKASEESIALAAQIAKMLAGRDPCVQGAALGDLTATWLAGHIVPGDPGATKELRRQLLAQQMELIVNLIPLNERES